MFLFLMDNQTESLKIMIEENVIQQTLSVCKFDTTYLHQ